jgi:two-component system, chemotaxis family, protein-glutamate methylesterase/glutaminase
VLLRRRFGMSAHTDRELAAQPYGIVAIASSAGGIAALRSVLGALPAQFPVPIVVVQHLDPRHETIIADVIGRRTNLETRLAVEGERVQPATIHIAPPNRHLLVESDGMLRLSQSEQVHFVRPSADLLFESLAGSYGPATLACVLTGSGSDGAIGAMAVKSRGGTVVVQDPESAQFDGMPQAAIDAGAADFVIPLDKVPELILGLVEAATS